MCRTRRFYMWLKNAAETKPAAGSSSKPAAGSQERSYEEGLEVSLRRFPSAPGNRRFRRMREGGGSRASVFGRLIIRITGIGGIMKSM